MTEENFGPFIEHDGGGCPPKLLGSVVEVRFEIVRNTVSGARAGSVFAAVGIVDEENSKNPMWDWTNAGKVSWYLGYPTHVGKIIRYRIKQFKALTEMKRAVERLETLPVVEVIDA